MKRKLITITVLIGLAGLAAVSCQQEAAEPQAPGEGILVEIPIALEQPGAAEADTKVDANLTTGVCGWTSGDQVAVYVSGSGANAYRNGTVNISNNTLATSVEPGQSLANYAVYPAGFQNPANYSGATPGVIYPATYSFTGHKDLSTGTYIMTPMMAVTGTDVMYFYHVGGMLRLALANVPTNAASLELTFVGMTHVCGTCTVTNPGTSKATTAITSGGGNVLTVTDFTQSATMYVNVPLPCGDYSSLTAIRVKVLDSTAGTLANVSKTATGWGTLKHGYARIVPVDFNVDALGSVKLSANTPVTLWKSQTIQRTAKALYGDGLPFADATITWGSNNTLVATVDATTGLVTAVGPGSATITATATSSLDPTSVVSADYTVYVNTFSVASVVAAKTTIGPGATTTVTATLTHTDNGTVLAFPADLSVAWTSSPDTYVTVATPSSVNVGTLQSVTTATGGTVGSSSTITASVPNYGTATANCSITCKDVASITFPSGGEKYKFRGLYLHPGVLFWNGSAFSVTDGTDPLVLLQHYYYDSQTGQTAKYGGSSGTAWVNCCYFTWDQLQARLGGSTNITGTVSANHPGTSTSYSWRIPSASGTSLDTNTDFGKIIAYTPAYSIKINSRDATTANTSNYVHVNVDLAGSPYAGKGLGYSTNIGDKAGDLNYQAGLLLIPDGAVVTCVGIQTSDYGSWNGTTASISVNVISYDDLCTLVSGGCVFLPAAGDYYESSWRNGGRNGSYWSSTPYSSLACNLYFYHGNVSTGGADTSLYFPVFLVRE